LPGNLARWWFFGLAQGRYRGASDRGKIITNAQRRAIMQGRRRACNAILRYAKKTLHLGIYPKWALPAFFVSGA
jgi:hypothetical protein